MKRRYSEESGYILVLAIFVVMGLLAVMMLAIDLGNLYIWRVRLERAAKAGVSAGLGYRTLKGWQALYGGKPQYAGGSLTIPSSPNTDLTELTTQVRRAFEETIEATNYHPGDFSYTVTSTNYDLARDEAAISVELTVPTLLIGRLTVFGLPMSCNATSVSGRPACLIKLQQRAALTPANIVLALDTSGSMECELETNIPAPLPNCGCRTSTTDPCGGIDGSRPRIISALKTAVIEFHKYFNPVRDRIAIVPFNLGANRSFSFMESRAPSSFGSTETRYNSFMATIGDPLANDGLIPFSNTNPCDAFIMAAEEIRDLKAHASLDQQALRPQIVFFTDGSPNAMRGAFINQDGRRLDDAKPSTTAANDWYQYSIEWNDGTMYRAPGPLFHASLPLFNKGINAEGFPEAMMPPTPTPSRTPLPIPTATPTPPHCGEPWYERPNLQFVGSLDAAEPRPTPPPSRTPGCLTKTAFDIPGAPGYGVRAVDFKSTSPEILYTNQLPFFCTVEAADYIRQQLNGTVFAVGLGKPPLACFNNDPLQDADNSFLRKDNFLSRVALDPVRTVDRTETTCSYKPKTTFQGTNTVTITNCLDHSLNNKTFKVGYTPPVAPAGATPAPNGVRAPDTFGPGTEGEYVGVENPLRLKVAFTRIAKQILLRLNN